MTNDEFCSGTGAPGGLFNAKSAKAVQRKEREAISKDLRVLSASENSAIFAFKKKAVQRKEIPKDFRVHCVRKLRDLAYNLTYKLYP